jgi:hypothetical protein
MKMDMNENYVVSFRAITPFLLVSFGLAWGILGLYIFLPNPMERMFGQLSGTHPLFYLAVYAPAISAFIQVIRFGDIAGLRRFLGRFLLWRCSAGWYVFIIIGIPVIFICGAALKGTLFSEPFPFESFPRTARCAAPGGRKGPRRRIRLARSLPSSSAAQGGSFMGRADSRMYMGNMAFSRFSAQWNSTKSVVFHRIFCRLPGNKCHRYGTFQQLARQYPVVGVLPFFSNEPDLSGCPTVRYLCANWRRSIDRLAKTRFDAHHEIFYHRSDSSGTNG